MGVIHVSRNDTGPEARATCRLSKEDSKFSAGAGTTVKALKPLRGDWVPSVSRASQATQDNTPELRFLRSERVSVGLLWTKPLAQPASRPTEADE
jgi:hypothetical protein